MSRTVAEKRVAFHALHKEGCFVLPNPWDVGSARMLQHLGFKALATTSSGHAWTLGRPDYGIDRDSILEHLRALSAVDLPINADFEAGFADDAAGVAANVTLAVEAGVAGISIEDTDVSGKGLYPKAVALERLKAALEVTRKHNVVLVARTEGLLHDATAVKPAIDKLVAFAEAGADCLYAPGVWKKDDISAMVRAVAPKPLNVLAYGIDLDVQQLADLGVRRISIGGALAAVGWGAVMKAAEQLKAGSFVGVRSGMPGKTLNALFTSG